MLHKGNGGRQLTNVNVNRDFKIEKKVNHRYKRRK